MNRVVKDKLQPHLKDSGWSMKGKRGIDVLEKDGYVIDPTGSLGFRLMVRKPGGGYRVVIRGESKDMKSPQYIATIIYLVKNAETLCAE